MADKNLHYLDVPRAEPAKTPVEARVTHFREIYTAFQPSRLRAGRGAASRAATRSASGSARFTTTFPTG